MKARTASEFQVVIEDAAPVDLDATPQLVRSAEPPPSLAQLIIRPGESGGLLTGTEFRFAKFCTEEKMKKRTFCEDIEQLCFNHSAICADSGVVKT